MYDLVASESDEESPLMPSSPVHERNLKRLKKAIKVSELPNPKLEHDPYTTISPPINYQPEPLHSNDVDIQDFEDSEVRYRSYGSASDGALQNPQPQDSQRTEEEDISLARVDLEFDSASQQEFVGNGVAQRMETEIEEEKSDVVIRREDEGPSEKKGRDFDGISSHKKRKKKNRIEGNDACEKANESFSNERRDAKERREHLKQLRAESQRLLRETKDVAFKPIPLVEKPISSVLEKIRLRKQQVSIKMGSYNERAALIDERLNMIEKVEGEETIAFPEYAKDGLCFDVQTGRSTDAADCTELEIISSHVVCEKSLDKEYAQGFRAPVDDTQDLFSYSKMSDTRGELSNDDSLQEEAFEPSILAMDLKLDSAPPDDVLSDEEDSEKENAIPHLQGSADLSSSPTGDPVKAFVDEEAVEEDDSDNDLNLQENEEDEENDDEEEIMGMISTTYEEKPIDNERRNQLHQQWLEQQDAAGTENLLQKLKYGSNLRDTSLVDEDEDEAEEHDGIVNDAEQDLAPTNVARMNLKRVKQMLPQVFTDKYDPYISDDEETESKLAKECLLQKTEEQAIFLSPAEDESSREVFGLIKKINTVKDSNKKAKPASIVAVPLTGQQRNMSSKSSFLCRGLHHSLPSQKNGSGSSKVRSFIFGRDDSKSRTSISTSLESSDMIHSSSQQRKSNSAKFVSNSQKNSSKSAMPSTSSKTSASLYEILKRPSLREAQSIQRNLVHQSESVFAAFKLTKKPIKYEGKI